MEINGPISVAINDNSDTGLRELHLGFKPAFQQAPLANRLESINQYMSDLDHDIQAASNPAEQQGMLTILQILQQIEPHLQADEIPLEQTIVIEVGPSPTTDQATPFDDLLRSATLK